MKRVALACLGVVAIASPAAAGPPDLTGKRLQIECRIDSPGVSNPWHMDFVFVTGKPGERVEAHLLNPPDKEIQFGTEATYRGTYSSSGTLDMLLYPNRMFISGVYVEIAGDGELSGKCQRGALIGEMGEASGRCVDCEVSGSWSPKGWMIVLAIFLMLSAAGKHIEWKQAEQLRRQQPQPDTSFDPLEDLRRRDPAHRGGR